MSQEIKLFINRVMKPVDQLAVFSTAIFLIVALISPSVKVYFLASLLWFFFLSLAYSFPKAVIYSVPLLMSLNVGQVYSFLAIPAAKIDSLQYWSGKHLFFVLSPHLIILIAAAIAFPFFYRQAKHKLNLFNHEKLFLVVLGLSLFSSIWPSPLQFLSITFFFREGLIVVWFLYLLLIARKKKERSVILSTLVSILITILSFETLLVLGQLVKGSSWGLLIEKSQLVPVFGLGAEEQAGVFRPFGWHHHANSLANNQIMMAAAALIFIDKLSPIYSQKTKRNLSFIILLMIVLTTFISLSRSAVLALVISGSLYLYIVFKNSSPKMIFETLDRSIVKLHPGLKIVLLAVSSLLILKMTNRLFYSSLSFTASGGVVTRYNQSLEAWNVFQRSPLWGFGVGMFIPISHQLFPDGVMRYFPEEIHNGFLLFLAERGAMASIVVLLFFYFLFKRLKRISLNRASLAMVYSGIAVGLIIMMFHPFINLFSLNVLAVLFIMHYEKETF